ncbi:hypothetical protein ABT061_47785 [Streptosporangium sp. NPDC002544]|uniref:hypothetical protein n=1 Tax=Streptosporangium sp. NPDC002544 TaxID=3154538 RepID=UPI003322F0D2
MDDAERKLSPQETLRLIEQQGSVAANRLTPDPVPHYLAWGVAWLVGYSALFLHHGLSGTPYAPIPFPLVLALLFGSMLAATLVSALTIWQLGSPVRGASQQRGTMYGLAWFFGSLAVWVAGIRFAPQLPSAEGSLLWASLSMTVVAVLYMAGGAIWLLRSMFVFGAGLAVLNAIGTVAGPGWHALLMSLGAGGGSIAAGLLLRRSAGR